MMKRILAVAAVVALLAGCDSKPDAPFGFEWGQSVDNVKKLGLSRLSCGDEHKDGFTLCHSESSPSGERGEFIFAFNDPKYKGLVTIDKKYKATNDKELLLEQYNKEKLDLDKKYGSPVKSSNQYDENRDFFFCLSDESCAEIKADYENDGVMSGVEIRSKDKNSGYISVYYIRK